ncbi:MAG TPA: protein phosphatase 2C domain-containing protein [Sphingomonas sp.]|nr:protein phosphatase 2C domain-containing protein [Sphingomonas sp.]
MDFELGQLTSQPCLGNVENDDAAGWVRTAASVYAWVIDGGTSLADENYLGAALGDVAWFANALSGAITRHAGRELSARDLHAEAAAAVARDYAALLGDRTGAVPLYACPIAAVTVIRITGTGGACRGDLFHLADCPAFTVDRGDKVRRITLGENVEAENRVRERVMASQSTHGFAPAAVMAEQKPWLRERREMQLRASPCPISTPAAGASFGGWQRSIDLAAVDAVILMSDGFERYVTEYALGDDREMIGATLRDGADAVLESVRALERSDAACRAFPRLKASDDATCLVLKRVTAGDRPGR